MDKAFVVFVGSVRDLFLESGRHGRCWRTRFFRYADLRCGVFDLGGSCDDTGFLPLDPGHIAPVLKSDSGETIRTSILACSL